MDQFTHVKYEISKYIGNEYTNGRDVWWMLKREKKKMTETPASLATDSTYFYREIFKINVSEYAKRRNRLRENLDLAFTLIIGQCTKLTRMQL